MKTPDLREESQGKLTNDVEWSWDVARFFPAQGQWSEEECFGDSRLLAGFEVDVSEVFDAATV
ncbi:MAG: hypothetical protein GXP42_09685 [Chloroflexi bacterium]|nr:hypothetical protein [Chloroflexota bacterium]